MYHIPCGAVRARRRDFFPGKMASNDASLYSLAAGSDASEGDPFELDGEPEVVSNQQPTNLQQPAQQQPTQQQQQADAGASGGASARQQDDTGELRKYLRTVSATAQPDLELDDESLTTLDNLFEKLVGQVMARAAALAEPAENNNSTGALITSLDVRRGLCELIPDGNKLRPPAMPSVVKRARALDKASIKGLRGREKRRREADAAKLEAAAGAAQQKANKL